MAVMVDTYIKTDYLNYITEMQIQNIQIMRSGPRQTHLYQAFFL